MRRKTGAILRETRPETIITSACRGLARKTSEPKRARSLRTRLGFSLAPRAIAPLEQAFLPDIDVADQEQGDEQHHLDEDDGAQLSAGGRERAEDDRPRHQEDQLDVEEDEDHRDQIELDREAFARRADRVFAALV